MSDAKLRRLHADISAALDAIVELFDKIHRDEVKITVVVRTPWLDDGGVLMGNDSYEEVVAEINRLRDRTPVEP